jgi:redox-sensitive bicupin YhaK (pirin superfamily)
MVGPFIFFDQMGPAEFLTVGGIDVRPHPHIGLATVTYLIPASRLAGHEPDDLSGRSDWIIEVAGERFESGRMMVFRPGDAITVRGGERRARLMLLGGETLNAPRYVWWNFVASSQEKIDIAKDAWAKGDWAHGRFHLPPGDDQEFIPLPDRTPLLIDLR